MNISKNIRELLKEKNMRHKDLADKAGISQGYFSDRLRSVNDFRVTLLIKIAEILGVTVAYLCRNDDEIVIKAKVKEVIEFYKPDETVRIEKENGIWQVVRQPI